MRPRDLSPAVIFPLLLAASCGSPSGAAELPARLDEITPACGDSASATPVVLRGLLPVKPVVSMSDPGGSTIDTGYRAWIGGGAGEVELAEVTWNDAETVTAIVPAGIAPGVYPLVLQSPFGQRVSKEGAFQVHRGACPSPGVALVTSAEVAPNAVTVGQQVTVTAVVRNGGREAASHVVGSMAAVPDGLVFLGSQQGPADIAAEQSATFTWTYNTTTTSPLTGATFSVDAAGLDPRGAPVASPRADSNVLLVNLPAILTGTSRASPRQVTLGQSITVTLSVANSGSAPAVVVPTIGPVTGSAAVTQTAAPTAQTIPGPGTSDFGWTFRADSSGVATFTAGATGTDANSGQPVAVAPLPSVTVTVAAPTLTVAPSTATVAAKGNPLSFAATLTGAPPGSAIHWTLSGLGQISATTGATVSYTPPIAVGATTQATLTASSIVSGVTITSSAQITITR